MNLDFKDRENFQEWRDQFINALSGTASADFTSQIVAASVVQRADGIAQAAVELIQARARESAK
jgi:hypothetical protein